MLHLQIRNFGIDIFYFGHWNFPLSKFLFFKCSTRQHMLCLLMLSCTAFENQKFWHGHFLLWTLGFSSVKILFFQMQHTTAYVMFIDAVVCCIWNSEILAERFLLLTWGFSSAKILFLRMQHATVRAMLCLCRSWISFLRWPIRAFLICKLP